ncbi:MAG: hypothetical protein QW290_03965 [Sulfolobales archaeon]
MSRNELDELDEGDLKDTCLTVGSGVNYGNLRKLSPVSRAEGERAVKRWVVAHWFSRFLIQPFSLHREMVKCFSPIPVVF